jgi:hypothetical protein
MGMIRFLSVLLVLGAFANAQAPEQPPPIEADQKVILDAIGAQALKYVQELPDFLCNQITRRNIDTSGTSQQWHLVETTDELLTYAGGKEAYKLEKINGKKAANADRGRSEGTVSIGDYGNLLSWIFDPKAKADFKWNAWASMHGRPVYVFAYTVPKERSQFMVGKKRAAAGISGIFWADRETHQVIRVAFSGQSPAGVSPQDISYDFDCDFVMLGDRKVLLPVTASYRHRDGKTFVWNEMEFRRYRQPAADSSPALTTR